VSYAPSRSYMNNDCDEGAAAEDAERGNILESVKRRWLLYVVYGGVDHIKYIPSPPPF
jgi:hypothetical protein